MIKLTPPNNEVVLTPPKDRTLDPKAIMEALCGEPVDDPPSPFQFRYPGMNFRQLSRYWYRYLLNRCEVCYGDGYNMDVDGPYICGPCKGSGKKNGED